MSDPIQGAVIVRFDEDGELSYHVFGGESVRLFIVDERAPNDRVYEYTSRDDAQVFRQIIPADAEIGSQSDERHAAIAHTISAHIEGRPRLALVSPSPNPHGDRE